MDAFGVFGVVVGILVGLYFVGWSLWGFFAEERLHKGKLQVYRNNGGMPYVSKHLWTAKDRTWEEQQEINRHARKVAGLED